MYLILNSFFVGFILNFFLIFLFRKIPIMTKWGWFSAGILGTLLWGCLGWQGWISVALYLFLGSIVTKIGYEYKNKIGVAEIRGGRRGPENVWGSAATGLFLALMIRFNLADLVVLKLGFAASFVAKLADTFGSEIGKRFGKNTFMITTLKKVERGTEGAISLEGTFASLLGSILMTIIMFLLGFVTTQKQLIIVSACGFVATILESYIGANFQERFNMSNELVNTIQTSISATLTIVFYTLFFY
tara:strand:- start:750 stop:1484 length:735 start_codon:yes stop_codon:yes gene_type:complete